MKHMVIGLLLFPLLASFSGAIGAFKPKHAKFFLGLNLLSMLLCTICGLRIFYALFKEANLLLNYDIYSFYNFTSPIKFGIFIDRASATMIFLVTTVATLVHFFSLAYMQDDKGKLRFFCYISLFTFMMLSLVVASNLLQIFFAWEGVGVMSYLLIGFWYTKPSAITANFKAFVVNRVGDLAFVLALAGIFSNLHSFDLGQILAFAPNLENVNFIASMLFVAAMAKSAQIPLHIWLPDSMEGPTPVSALIHAATMVTAGIFLLIRSHGILELSPMVLSTMLIIGSISCVVTGTLAIFQTDIKKVIAYSTLSQLGIMMAAIGASAYSLAIYHLFTHGFFKASLFLGAGSCILIFKHKQNLSQMGELYKYAPATYINMLIASFSLIGFPCFAGFFSKDAILLVVKNCNYTGSQIAYILISLSIFITTFYTSRLIYLIFHAPSCEEHSELKESPKLITVPLFILTGLSLISGVAGSKIVFSGFFNNHLPAIKTHISRQEMLLHSLKSVNSYLIIATICLVFWGYKNAWHKKSKVILDRLNLNSLIANNFYFDNILAVCLPKIVYNKSLLLSSKVEHKSIDKGIVMNTATVITSAARKVRKIQTGYLPDYLMLIIGFIVMLIIYLG